MVAPEWLHHVVSGRPYCPWAPWAPWQEDPAGHLEAFPPPNPSELPPRPSSYLLLEPLLLCFPLHTLLLSHQLLSQTVGFLEEEGRVAGKESESNREASMEGSGRSRLGGK